MFMALWPFPSRQMPPPFPTPRAQVGTAHGRTLEALMRNNELNGLVGIACALGWHWTALTAVQYRALFAFIQAVPAVIHSTGVSSVLYICTQVGGITTVTLGDAKAEQTNGG